MNYLLDTCVVSELINWIDSVDEIKLYLSVITFGEIEKGISKLPTSKRKSIIMEWLHEDLLILTDILIKWGTDVSIFRIRRTKNAINRFLDCRDCKT